MLFKQLQSAMRLRRQHEASSRLLAEGGAIQDASVERQGCRVIIAVLDASFDELYIILRLSVLHCVGV